MHLPGINIFAFLSLHLSLQIVIYRCDDIDEHAHARQRFSSHDVLIFSTCNSRGRDGPSFESCSISYTNTSLESVTVEKEWPGVQIWTVPKTGRYGILALGAMGGRSTQHLPQLYDEKHRAKYVFAFYNLTAGSRLHLLVGQKGQDACSMKDCEKIDLNRSSLAGGGGGGTFVFQVDQSTNQIQPLLIAGGCGGVGIGTFHKDQPILCREYHCTKNASEERSQSLAANGASWDDVVKDRNSIIGGTVGGLGCLQQNGSHQMIGGYGGFGGGGSSCREAGGGGGGYIGGRGGGEGIESNGQDGASFISNQGEELHYDDKMRRAHRNGEVQIYEYFYCPCEHYCVGIKSENQNYTCMCASGKVLMPDNHSCQDVGRKSYLPYKELIIPFFVGVFIVAILIITYKVVRVVKRRLNLASSESGSGSTLVSKTTPGHINSIVMQINASYSAVNFTTPEMEITQIPREQIKCIRLIGRGAFGEVFEGTLAPNGMEQHAFKVAIKTLPAVCTEDLEVDFVMEAVIMSKFEHPNIVTFLGVCFDSVRPHYIVLELLQGGSLKEFLFEARPTPENPSILTVLELVKISIDIAKGCQYLEERHFIHRDIAARNCLLTTKGSDRVVKIADFGMARDIYRSDYYRKTGRALLPVKWMPPEAFLDGVFTSKSDVWAYGITLWEIFSMASNPYPGQANHEVMEFVLEGGRLRSPENCPLGLYHIMTCTWDSNPDIRPSFAAIVHKLQYCYDDPNTATFKLPTFDHFTSHKGNILYFTEIEKGSSRRARKKSSTSSIYSLSSLDSLNFNESNRKPYNKELGFTEGDVVNIPKGYASNMISCFDAKDGTNESIDNPTCRALLVDLDSCSNQRSPHKDSGLNGFASGIAATTKRKSNYYSRDLTGEPDNSQHRNHERHRDDIGSIPIQHSFLYRHYSHPYSNKHQNHYTRYPKRHRSLHQQQKPAEGAHNHDKSKLNTDSNQSHRQATSHSHPRDSTLHRSPSKTPLLSSPLSEYEPENNIRFYARQKQDETREKIAYNNIPMKNMRKVEDCRKYINVATNVAYLNTTILDENNC